MSIGLLASPPPPMLEALERRPTSAMTEEALVRGYQVPELSITHGDRWTKQGYSVLDNQGVEPTEDRGRTMSLALPDDGYVIGRRLFLPCACGVHVGAAPDEIDARLVEHQATPEHARWRNWMGL